MNTNLILAEAATAAQLGIWCVIAVAGIGVLMLAVTFVTRRDVDRIDARVNRLEEGQHKTQAAIQEVKDQLTISADRRSSILHNRINPLVENMSGLKGAQEAFVQSFDNFTEALKALLAKKE